MRYTIDILKDLSLSNFRKAFHPPLPAHLQWHGKILTSHFTLKTTALRFLGFRILHKSRPFTEFFVRFTLNFQDYF